MINIFFVVSSSLLCLAVAKIEHKILINSKLETATYEPTEEIQQLKTPTTFLFGAEISESENPTPGHFPSTDNPTPVDFPKATDNPTPVNFPATDNPTPVDFPRATDNPTPVDFPRATDNPTPVYFPRATDNPTPVDFRVTDNPTPLHFHRATDNPTPVDFPKATDNPTPVYFSKTTDNPTPAYFSETTDNPTPVDFPRPPTITPYPSQSPTTPFPTVVAFTVSQDFFGLSFSTYLNYAAGFDYCLGQTVADILGDGISSNNVRVTAVTAIADDPTDGILTTYNLDLTSSDARSFRGFEATFEATYDDAYGSMHSTLSTAADDGQFTSTFQQVAAAAGFSIFANITAGSLVGSPTASPSQFPTVSSTLKPTLSIDTVLSRDAIAIICVSIAVLFVSCTILYYFYCTGTSDSPPASETTPLAGAGAAPASPLASQVAAINKILAKGIYLHTSKGPKKVKMNLSNSRLVWHLNQKPIEFSMITEVKYCVGGKVTTIFTGPTSAGAPDERCLSLVCIANTTIDLECDTEADKQLLLENFHQIIEKIVQDPSIKF